MIVIKTKVKEIVSENGINNITEDFVERLNCKVKEMVKEHCKRAKENNRRTVMGKDI